MIIQTSEFLNWQKPSDEEGNRHLLFISFLFLVRLLSLLPYLSPHTYTHICTQYLFITIFLPLFHLSASSFIFYIFVIFIIFILIPL